MLTDTKCERHKGKEEFEMRNREVILPSLNQLRLVRTMYKCFGPDAVSVCNAKTHLCMPGL